MSSINRWLNWKPKAQRPGDLTKATKMNSVSSVSPCEATSSIISTAAPEIIEKSPQDELPKLTKTTHAVLSDEEIAARCGPMDEPSPEVAGLRIHGWAARIKQYIERHPAAGPAGPSSHSPESLAGSSSKMFSTSTRGAFAAPNGGKATKERESVKPTTNQPLFKWAKEIELAAASSEI